MSNKTRVGTALSKIDKTAIPYSDKEILESRMHNEFEGKNGYKLRVELTVATALVALVDREDNFIGHVMLDPTQRQQLKEML